MKSQDDLCTPFDHGQEPDLVKSIIQSLPSLKTRLEQHENPACTLCHYEPTADINTFGRGLLENLDENEKAFRSKGLQPRKPDYNPEVVQMNGAWYRINPNETAVICPMANAPVDILIWKDGDPQEEIIAIRQTLQPYLVYPDARVRLWPDDTPFHKTSVPVTR